MDIRTIYTQNIDAKMAMGQNVNFCQVTKETCFASEKHG